MSGIKTTIHEAFKIELSQFAIDNSILNARANIKFDPDTSKPYLAGTLIFAPTEQADLGFTELRQGFYQVDINYASHTGTGKTDEMADLLNAKFYAGSNLNRLGICIGIESFDFGPTLTVDGWARTPVTINFNAYTARITS